MEEKSVSNISNPNDKLAKSIKKAIKIREDEDRFAQNKDMDIDPVVKTKTQWVSF